MQYREYGLTGKKVSLLGFGGMRFKNINNYDECIHTIITAAEGGITYFDTAPDYCEGKSEKVFGLGFAELRKRNFPYYSATKTFASSEADVRRQLENSLKTMGIPCIDFYHIWCVLGLDEWQRRKNEGVLKAFRKMKEEGLIKHICVSSHLINDDIKELLLEGVFEGVLFGYSAYNFQQRQAAFDAIREKKLGAIIMNPLGGGVIPNNKQRFAYLARTGEGVVAAALSFLWDHPEITSTLVGFEDAAQVKEALAAMENYKPRTEEELAGFKKRILSSLDKICTGCAYCDNCPNGIPIPKFMDVYNQLILNEEGSGDPMSDRLYWHWRLDRSIIEKCKACGQCERECTQHLNIIERLKIILG